MLQKIHRRALPDCFAMCHVQVARMDELHPHSIYFEYLPFPFYIFNIIFIVLWQYRP